MPRFILNIPDTGPLEAIFSDAPESAKTFLQTGFRALSRLDSEQLKAAVNSIARIPQGHLGPAPPEDVAGLESLGKDRAAASTALSMTVALESARDDSEGEFLSAARSS